MALNLTRRYNAPSCFYKISLSPCLSLSLSLSLSHTHTHTHTDTVIFNLILNLIKTKNGSLQTKLNNYKTHLDETI